MAALDRPGADSGTSLVYVDEAGALDWAHTESASGSAEAAWADWSADDRERVEAFVAAGRQQLRAAPSEHGVPFSPEKRAGAVLQSIIGELVDSGELDAEVLDTGVSEARLDTHDVRWVRTLFGLVREALEVGRFDWLAPPEEPDTIANDCRIAIVGDWGSGLYGAPECARSIVNDRTGADAVIHLGDIYYSGTSKEVRRNFLSTWPNDVRNADDSTLFRACNGNHEMYSGGRAYAKQVLPKFDQASSAFAMENDSWLVVGLDTAYDEWELGQGQADWLRRLLERCDDRRAILLSHHQPFSHYSAPKRKLREQIEPIIGDFRSKVLAWYWGHEHIGAIYDAYEPWGVLGRCVGHSGFPYFRIKALADMGHRDPVDVASGAHLVEIPASEEAPAALVVDGENPYLGDSGRDRYGPHGYMTLDLSGDEIHETLRAADGRVVWESDR